MSKKLKRFSILLMCILMITSVLPATVFAQGKIDTDRPVELIIDYKDGTKAISNARFALYKVADVDEYIRMALTEDFKAYKSTVSGLADLDNMTQEQWLTLASTLKGYVQKDKLLPVAEGKTDSNGSLSFRDLSVGLYLVLGNRATTSDFYTYSAVPFMIFLPDRDSVNNDWNYEVTVVPKYTKEYYPPNSDDEYITRKVLKQWDDEGYETIRPQEIIVQLLRDGEVYDTQTLNKNNNWRYAWDNLDAKYEWLVVEKEAKGYTVTITQNGITFIAVNKFVAPVTGANLPVLKRITGVAPKEPSTFTFVLSAKDVAYPMPKGSSGSTKEVSITGAGSAEFGEITFTEPGTYVYTVIEKNGGVKNYTYDTNVYTVTYEVVLNNGELSVTRQITNKDGNTANAVEFTNPYTPPEVPQTGMLWWPVPVFLLAGFTFVIVGILYRRRYN